MHILITGGSGFLGTALIHRLLQDQHSISVISRHPEQFPLSHPLLTITTLKKLNSLGYADIVINLAGAGIADQRWTEQRKSDLLHSRLQTTQALINWFNQLAVKPQQFLSGSAIGWYGSHDNTVLTELSTAQSGFTHELCAQWEQCALQAQDLGISTTLLRTGVVLDQSGGMLARLKPIYQWGLGGKIGSGQQWMSWISRHDWINAVLFLMQHPLAGAVNLVAPTPVTQAQFAQNFASTLYRPAWLPMPSFVAKLAFGEMSHLFLDSQKIIPERLLQAGFKFEYPDLITALSH